MTGTNNSIETDNEREDGYVDTREKTLNVKKFPFMKSTLGALNKAYQ